jgi:hypothetical protein
MMKTIDIADLDKRIERLGQYFVYFNIHDRYNLTFERFVQLVNSGIWTEFVEQEEYIA